MAIMYPSYSLRTREAIKESIDSKHHSLMPSPLVIKKTNKPKKTAWYPLFVHMQQLQFTSLKLFGSRSYVTPHRSYPEEVCNVVYVETYLFAVDSAFPRLSLQRLAAKSHPSMPPLSSTRWDCHIIAFLG